MNRGVPSYFEDKMFWKQEVEQHDKTLYKRCVIALEVYVL